MSSQQSLAALGGRVGVAFQPQIFLRAHVILWSYRASRALRENSVVTFQYQSDAASRA